MMMINLVPRVSLFPPLSSTTREEKRVSLGTRLDDDKDDDDDDDIIIIIIIIIII